MIGIDRTYEFADWFRRLRDRNAKARIAVRIDRIEATGNLGDSKSVDEAVYELRIPYGPGYRLYYAWRGDTLLLLLLGGDKSTQERDIEKAKWPNKEYI